MDRDIEIGTIVDRLNLLESNLHQRLDKLEKKLISLESYYINNIKILFKEVRNKNGN